MSSIRSFTPFVLALMWASAAHAGISPESATTEVRSATPGTTYRGTVVVRNSGSKTVDVKLYRTDYAFSADGRSSYATPGQLPRSNAPWLRLVREQIRLAPGERGSVDYEVSVPNDTQLTGTYWSAVMLEQLGGAEQGTTKEEKVQLRQVVRYAIQVITEIGATGTSAIAFSNAHLSSAGGKRELAVDIENTGERWLQAQVWLELHDANGHLAGKFSGQRLRTFPATSVRNHIDLTAVPPGKYIALLIADAGRNDLFGTQLDLDVR
jgi:hypothetical protein